MFSYTFGMEILTKNPIKIDDFSRLTHSEIAAIFQIQEDKNSLLSKQVELLQAKLSWFEEQFNLLKHKHFAQSSEQHAVLQMEIFDEDETALQVESNKPENPETEEISYVRNKKNTGKNKRLDTSLLPREKCYIDLTEAEKQCDCGSCLTKIGEESREELVFIPATLKVVEHIRIKYTCRACETIKMPKAVELPLAKSKAGASLLADIMLNKYRYHLPFYRQSKILAHFKIKIPDQTIAGWVMNAAERLSPLGDALWKLLPSVKALQADETPVKILDPGKKAYMWLYHSYLPDKKFVIFDFHLNRSQTVVDERLKSFQGLLQTDGYAGYNTQRKRDDVITFGCWDHARRKFADVVKVSGNSKSGKAGKMLEKIAKLYLLEQEIKDLSFEERKKIRQAKAKPLLAAIKGFLDKINAPPKSLLQTAVTYCKNQWDELIRYVDHGEVQISNCWIENQVRPFALGRRNWLFVGNEESAKKAALIYSLIQSCELNKIDPRSYLTYVLNQTENMRRNLVDPAALLPNTIDPALLQPIN